MKDSIRPIEPKRFLVISTTGIGDTLMGTPALRALRESFPRSEIHLLVNAKKKDLLRENPDADRVIDYRNNVLYRRYLSWKLRKTPYDHVLIFHANEDVLEFLGALTYGDCFTRQNLEDPVKRIFRVANLPRHSVQRRMAMVERVGGKPTTDYRYQLSLPEESARWAAERLARWNVGSADLLVGFQLGAADGFKCWPVEFFVETARHLRGKHRARIYLNAVRKEKGLVERFLALHGPEDVFFHMEGGLTQSAALIRACSLFISGDTGPMHLAIGLDVPLIALFCPTDSRETGPLAYDRGAVIRKEVPCSPCLSRRCPDPFCMRQIGVEEVCQAADAVLSGEAARERGPFR